MNTRRLLRCVSVILLSLVVFAQVEPALADGGIVIPDHELWASIQEGQQTAVIVLQDDDTVQVDLFITMVDRTGTSHQVVFFVPLGRQASQFSVVEERSLDFEIALTEKLDQQIRDYAEREANYASNIQAGLLVGTLLTNGLWTWLVAWPLVACGGAQAPIATFETASSFISIYALDQQTDITGLIETTGLDASVKETLEFLRGQEIAVVQLQTQPEAAVDDWLTGAETQGQPGIHLTWVSTLEDGPHGSTYTYPLGTGRAWASPIELTRIYIVAPQDSDFQVQYPKLGTDLSGLEGSGWGSWSGLAGRIYWRIDEATSPAFAVDDAYGSYGHIWRATFVKSNSEQDIVVTRLTEPSASTRSAIRQGQLHLVFSRITWIISLLVGAALWLATWYLVMTRVLKVPYNWKTGRLYGDAFLWSLVYPLITLGVLVVIGLLAAGLLSLAFTTDFGYSLLESTAGNVALGIIAGLPVLVCLVGIINAFFFARSQSARLEVTRGRAFGAYMLTVLVANVAYAIYAVVYAAAVGAL